jgi:hypothetical protein
MEQCLNWKADGSLASTNYFFSHAYVHYFVNKNLVLIPILGYIIQDSPDANISHTFHSKVLSESDMTRMAVSHNALQKITNDNVCSSWSLLRNVNKVIKY